MLSTRAIIGKSDSSQRVAGTRLSCRSSWTPKETGKTMMMPVEAHQRVRNTQLLAPAIRVTPSRSPMSMASTTPSRTRTTRYEVGGGTFKFRPQSQYMFKFDNAATRHSESCTKAADSSATPEYKAAHVDNYHLQDGIAGGTARYTRSQWRVVRDVSGSNGGATRASTLLAAKLL